MFWKLTHLYIRLHIKSMDYKQQFCGCILVYVKQRWSLPSSHRVLRRCGLEQTKQSEKKQTKKNNGRYFGTEMPTGIGGGVEVGWAGVVWLFHTFLMGELITEYCVWVNKLTPSFIYRVCH